MLPGWSVWAGCSVTGAASSPAPRQRCNPLSAARWPPGRDQPKKWLQRQMHGQITCHKNVSSYCDCVMIYAVPKCQCVCVFCTLLSFSPSVWGRSVLRDWKPALMLCMRRRSLLLAISRRILLSWSWAVSGLRGMLARLKEQKRERWSTF